jgi:hypothetical protein
VKIFRRFIPDLLNIHFLLFINGFLIAGFLFCSFQADYENRLFASIAKNISVSKVNISQDSLLKKAVTTTYSLLIDRSKVFYSGETGGFLDNVIHPLSTDMMTAEGACGSYTAVLCRILNSLGYTTRFGQMNVDSRYGGHIIAEAKTLNGWVVLDPKYNLCFTKPDGHLAGFKDVAANWEWYKKQVPATYNLHYNYNGVRYTNWNKIPVIMPAIKETLSLFMGENDIQQISLRNYFVNKYAVCSNFLLLLIFPLSIFIMTKMTNYKFSSFKIKLHNFPHSFSNGHTDHTNA